MNSAASAVESTERPPRLLDREEARHLLGNLSNGTFYGLIKSGHLRPPIKIGTASRWLEADVVGLIEKLSATARRAPTAPASLKKYRSEQNQRQAAVAGGA